MKRFRAKKKRKSDLRRDLGMHLELLPDFTEQLFHHLVQQPLHAYGPTMGDDLRRTFVAQGLNIRKLAVAALAESALTGRETKVVETTGTGR
jgi:hypothetical protein